MTQHTSINITDNKPVMIESYKLQQLILGARDIFPLILAAIPFGIVYGAMAHAQGMSSAAIMGMSLFVFAGAAQFIAVTLLASAAALPVILLTVFVVNLRHLLYAASLMDQAEKHPQWLRAIMAFWLTDETFAVIINKVNREPDVKNLHWYYIGSALFMYCNWQLCTWIGITLGQHIPDLTTWGLDIAMVVAFTSTLLTHQWPHQTGLLFSALLAITVGVMLERKFYKMVTE